MGKSVFMTGVAIANSMIGSSMIIFPLNFNKYGIVVNSLFVIFMAGIMAMTCKLLVSHLQPDELDIAQSIKRKLGPAFFTSFGVMSSITLFLVSSVFFLLAVDIFYDVFLELFGEVSLPEKAFKLILMFVFAALNYLKNLDYVFKLSPVAMGALIISTLTLIGSIPFNLDHINSSFFDFPDLSFKDILAVASINGFALICHPSVSPMIKENADQKSNGKAVYVGYGITTVLYLLVGVLGALAIFHRGEDKHNIIEYFSGSFQAPLIGFLIFIYLFLISPIFPYVSKNQALQLIPQSKKQKISNLWLKASIIFGAIWLVMNTLFIIFDTSPLIVISFITAVMGFYITYFLPIYMTVKKGDYVPKNVEDENLQKSLIDGEDSNAKTKAEPSSIISLQDTDTEAEENGKISLLKKVFYGALLLYGAVLFVTQLISFFT